MFEELCSANGIIHQTTASFSPQSNGVAQCKNQTLKQMTNVLLISSGMPHIMWGNCFDKQLILNKISLKDKDVTPYELWKGRKSSYK